MVFTVEHVINDNFTIQDQHGCYLDCNGEQIADSYGNPAIYLKPYEITAVITKMMEAQFA